MRTGAASVRLLASSRFVRVAIVALACDLTACGSATISGPSQQGPLRLTTRSSRTTISPGQTATVTYQLENLSTLTITLHFADGCQILPYIAKASGEIVYPGGGGWGCTLALSSLTLPAGGSKTLDVTVGAASEGPYPYVSLSPGSYSAYATVRSGELSLTSASVLFTIQ